MWIEYRSPIECVWVERRDDGVYTASRGTPVSCIQRAIALHYDRVVVIPPVAMIRPRFAVGESRTSWFQKSSLPPLADYAIPIRQLPHGTEYVCTDFLDPDFRSFVTTFGDNGIDVDIDYGCDEGAESLVIIIDDGMSHVWYTDARGVPLVVRSDTSGINDLRSIVRDYARVSNPDTILMQHGFLRTHYDYELLDALVQSLDSIVSRARILSHLDRGAYQHPLVRVPPTRCVVQSSLAIPGLPEYLASSIGCDLDTISFHTMPCDMSIDTLPADRERIMRATTRSL